LKLFEVYEITDTEKREFLQREILRRSDYAMHGTPADDENGYVLSLYRAEVEKLESDVEREVREFVELYGALLLRLDHHLLSDIHILPSAHNLEKRFREILLSPNFRLISLFVE